MGKSTLTEHINLGKETNLVTFDSPLTLAAAMSDPVGFIKSLPNDKLNIAGEVQMVPEVSFNVRLLNNAAVMKEIGLDAKTYTRYKGLANNTFLTFETSRGQSRIN